MKTQTSFRWFSNPVFVAAALFMAVSTAPAQETTAASAAAIAGQPAPLLSYGVDQIIRLSQASVSEDTIINFIHNSGSSYGLDANQIVYLKQQGVSDNVINTMLSQPRPQDVAPVITQPSATATATATATVVTQPESEVYQVPPIYVPSSSVYVIPDSQTYRYYAYTYQPYYGGRNYLGYYRPHYYGSYVYYGSRPYYGNRVVHVGRGGGGNYRGGWHR